MKILHDGTEVSDDTPTRMTSEGRILMTAEEIAARQAEEAAHNTAQIAAHLPKYGKALEDSALTVQGFTEDGTEEHRRNAKEALDFIEELGENAPASIPWASPNHGSQTVTPAVLKAWLVAAGMRRLKRFEIQASLDPFDYDTIKELEEAFDAAYKA